MIRALRRWTAHYSARGRYSPVAQLFHWGMAALVLFQLGWGWHMGRVPAGGDKLRAFEIHANVGLLMLLLALLRLGWRVLMPPVINDADRLGWQTKLAGATHVLFYICLVGLPLSGWAMTSAVEGQPMRMGGFLPWPHMPFDAVPVSVRWWVLDWAESLHVLLILLLLALLPLHVGAALKHHFQQRDVLVAMLPELPDDQSLKVQPHAKPPPAPPPATAGG